MESTGTMSLPFRMLIFTFFRANPFIFATSFSGNASRIAVIGPNFEFGLIRALYTEKVQRSFEEADSLAMDQLPTGRKKSLRFIYLAIFTHEVVATARQDNTPYRVIANSALFIASKAPSLGQPLPAQTARDLIELLIQLDGSCPTAYEIS